GRLRPGRDGQPRGVHRCDGAARRAQPRGAAAEPIERARPLLAPGARAADRARQRRSRMTRRRTLRTLVEAKQGLIVPGAYDAISAKLVQQAGFPAVYMTGYGTSASRLGLPDLGFAGLAEMVDHARNLVAVLDVPLLADADTGYGNALNVRRTVQMYEATGVAALHIEDQVTPKRCGHLSGHQVIPRAEFTGKIRAAVEARTDPDLLVIARTDAISAVDADEALRRGEAAAKAGADVLFIEAPRDAGEVERVASAFETPLLYNYAPGGRSPLLPFARLRELGFAIVLLPVDTLLVAVQAIRDFLAAAKARDAGQALRRDTRQLEDTPGEAVPARLPGVGEVIDLVRRPREHPPHLRRQVARVARAEHLVSDDADRLALLRQAQHGLDEVRPALARAPRHAEEAGDAEDDGPLAPRERQPLALELRLAVDVERVRRVGLPVGRGPPAVEHVVGGEVDERRAEGLTGRGECLDRLGVQGEGARPVVLSLVHAVVGRGVDDA